MCIALPGKVISIEGKKAVVDYGEVQNPAIIDVSNVQVGDMVQVQMGIIIRVITTTEAKASQAAFDALFESAE